jgi:hypothetical protein
MGLEVATHVDDLVVTNPLVTDGVTQGDDHLRLLKTVLKTTFPSFNRPFYHDVYTATAGDVVLLSNTDRSLQGISAAAAARTVTLPDTPAVGTEITVVKTDSSTNLVTVSRAGTNTINGGTTFILRVQNQVAKFKFIGGGAWIAWFESSLRTLWRDDISSFGLGDNAATVLTNAHSLLNLFVGKNVGGAATTTRGNTILGQNAFSAFVASFDDGVTANGFNTGVGLEVFETLNAAGVFERAEQNTTLGAHSSRYATTASYNTVAGLNAYYCSGVTEGSPGAGTGTHNAVFGYKGAFFATSASFNAIFGSSAGFSITTALNNSFFGFQAGGGVTTGNFCLYLGYGAGGGAADVGRATTGSNNLLLSAASGPLLLQSATGSNQLSIGNIIFGTGVNGVTGTTVDVTGKIGIRTATPDSALSVNGQLSAADGSVSAPTFTNIGDLDTGIYFPLADTIGIGTAGAERARITTTGVGIGGTPLFKLQVFGNADGAAAGPVQITSAAGASLGAALSITCIDTGGSMFSFFSSGSLASVGAGKFVFFEGGAVNKYWCVLTGTTGRFGITPGDSSNEPGWTPDNKFHVEELVTTNSVVANVARIAARTSHASGPAVGIGAGLEFEVHTANGLGFPANSQVGMRVAAVTTDVTIGSADFDFVVSLMQNGAAYAEKFRVASDGLVTIANATMLKTSVTFTNGAGVATGTLTNAPTAGNPTKWIPVDDNGTTRHIPAW